MQRDGFAEPQLTLEQDLVHSPLMQHLFELVCRMGLLLAAVPMLLHSTAFVFGSLLVWGRTAGCRESSVSLGEHVVICALSRVYSSSHWSKSQVFSWLHWAFNSWQFC